MPSAQTKRWHSFLVTLGLCTLVSGCGTTSMEKRSPSWGAAQKVPNSVNRSFTQNENTAPDQTKQNARPEHGFYQAGSDKFTRKSNTIADARVDKEGDIKLNFQNADILEVVKVILGDMLKVTYVVDPKIQGSVSMQTSDALTLDDLIPTLELLLRMNNAAIITDSGIYKIVPLANAVTGIRSPQLGDSRLPLPSGYSVRVVPLKFVSAEEMAQILEPFVTGSNQLLRVDSQRNLLVLAAGGGDMGRLLETIHVFDVDRMSGMSVAMFTPDFVDAKTLADELEKLLADPDVGLMTGLVRFILVERLNGLMVVTPRAEYLTRVRDWVKRLDRDSGSAGSRLFIYRVQNGKATELADIMSKLFQKEAQAIPAAAEVAPGLTAATVGQVAAEPASPAAAMTPPLPRPAPTATSAGGTEGLSLSNDSQVRIIADEPNNALLILASSSEYRQILTALKQLDISPMQVLVEVTIAEVTLSDDLQYGVEWFFNNKVGGSLTGIGTLDLGTSGIAGIIPGFSYAFQSSGGTVNAVINMLSTESNLSIISSPSLLVLNNQEASIQVGDEVPVSTQQQQTTDATANILNSIEYRETGVKLKVKPRINSGGLVIMEVEQETSVVPSTNNTDPLTPRIQTRKISSTVAVNSGDTIILGGLIQDNHNQSESGIPMLSKVPLVGNLFGTKADNLDRTELLVLITPRAISHRTSALQVTEEFRRKLHSLIPVDENAKPLVTPPLGQINKSTPAIQEKPQEKLQQPKIAAPAANSICERIGPFENADAAKALLTNNKLIRSNLSSKTELANLGYQVILQGLEDESEATLEKIKADGFTEALLYTAGPSQNNISLGVFGRRSNAEKLSVLVDEKGYQSSVVELNRERTAYWIELERPSNDSTVDSSYKGLSNKNLSRLTLNCQSIASR